jgi:broad specificity phosphatase PhoE
LSRIRIASLPRVTLHLVRHGRPLVDPATSPSRWELDPVHEPAIVALAGRAPWRDDAVWFTSPEPKARRTALLLAGRDVDVDVVDDLREHYRGDGGWVDDFAGAVAEAFAHPSMSVRHGWEPLERTRSRVTTAARAIFAAHPGRDVVLVGHGTAWTLLVAALTATDPDLDRWRRLAMPDVLTVESAAPPATPVRW